MAERTCGSILPRMVSVENVNGDKSGEKREKMWAPCKEDMEERSDQLCAEKALSKMENLVSTSDQEL